MKTALLFFSVVLAVGWCAEEKAPSKETEAKVVVAEPSEIEQLDDKEKRFYSWEGGKRWADVPGKRKFYAWAGKRSDGAAPKRK
jgi:hypothetical protein